MHRDGLSNESEHSIDCAKGVRRVERKHTLKTVQRAEAVLLLTTPSYQSAFALLTSGCRRRTSARLWFDRQQSACFSSDSRYVLCRCSSHSCLWFFKCDSPFLSRHSTRAVSVLILVAQLFPGAETFRAVQVTLILRRSVWIDCRLQENGGYKCVLPQWCTFPFR